MINKVTLLFSLTPLLACVALAGSAGDSAPLPKLKHPIAVIAHRAGRGIMPENTLAAIQNAIKLGVDYVELDIRATKDGQTGNHARPER